VTLQPSAEDSKDTPAVEELKKIRPLLAWGLLGVNALWLLIAIEAFLFEGEGARSDFAVRAALAFGETPYAAGFPGLLTIGLVGIPQIVLPLLAVALVSHLKPVMGKLAKPVLITALVQYAVSALFGLIAFIASFTVEGEDQGRLLTESAFYRVGLFVLLGLAAFIAVKAALPYFKNPDAALQFGGYPQQGDWSGAPGQQFFGGPPAGEQQQGQHSQPSFQGQPGVPGRGPQPGQPPYAQPGQPPYGGQPGQPYGGQPGQPYGGQPVQPSYGQPGQPPYAQPGQGVPGEPPQGQHHGYGPGPGAPVAPPPVSGQPGGWGTQPPPNS